MKQTKTVRWSARLIASLVLAATAHQVSGEESYDLEKVSQCVSCHGADGRGKAAMYPDLSGKPAQYILAQLQYFKSGLRKNSSMNVIAAPLSEADMQMLADFFSQVQ